MIFSWFPQTCTLGRGQSNRLKKEEIFPFLHITFSTLHKLRNYRESQKKMQCLVLNEQGLVSSFFFFFLLGTEVNLLRVGKKPGFKHQTPLSAVPPCSSHCPSILPGVDRWEVERESRGWSPAHRKHSYRGLLIASVLRVPMAYSGLSPAVLEELLAGSFTLELGFEDPKCARGACSLDSFDGGLGRR